MLLLLDATEVMVRRPAARQGGRRAFVSGKKRQNVMKATVEQGPSSGVKARTPAPNGNPAVVVWGDSNPHPPPACASTPSITPG